MAVLMIEEVMQYLVEGFFTLSHRSLVQASLCYRAGRCYACYFEPNAVRLLRRTMVYVVLLCGSHSC
jgi:hypothetical protein